MKLFLFFALLQSGGDSTATPHPFGVGEQLVYSAKLGFIRLGTGNIEVARIDTVRGMPAYYFRFGLSGGNSLYRLNSLLDQVHEHDPEVAAPLRRLVNAYQYEALLAVLDNGRRT